jgi:uncharacterized protein (UPF0332 family)
MNHLDFLDTSERLVSMDGATEADIRSAISRAYYAVYHHVQLWWKGTHRFPDYKDRAHAKIQMALNNAGIPAVKVFSRDLKDLNNERQKADYRLALRFDLETGRRILDRARRAITAFDDIDKAALKDGIEDYLRKTNQL